MNDGHMVEIEAGAFGGTIKIDGVVQPWVRGVGLVMGVEDITTVHVEYACAARFHGEHVYVQHTCPEEGTVRGVVDSLRDKLMRLTIDVRYSRDTPDVLAARLSEVNARLAEIAAGVT